jgi:hypothetical protein
MHRLLSFLPFFGFLPSQMPGQQLALLPRHLLPTLTQPKAFSFGFCLAFFPFLASPPRSRDVTGGPPVRRRARPARLAAGRGVQATGLGCRRVSRS